MRPMEVKPVDEITNQKIREVCPGVSVTGPGTSAGPDKTHPVWGSGARAAPELVSRSGGAAPRRGRRHADGPGPLPARHGGGRRRPPPPGIDRHPVAHRLDRLAHSRQGHRRLTVRVRTAAPLVHRLPDEGLRFAVPATPCDVSAIRSLGRTDPRVENRIPYLLTIFCSGVHHAGVPKSMIRCHGVEEDEVEIFRYRGNGWPGPTRIQTKQGVTHDITYRQAWLEPAPWRYDMQFRCRICPPRNRRVRRRLRARRPENGRPIHEEAPFKRHHRPHREGTTASGPDQPGGLPRAGSAVDGGVRPDALQQPAGQARLAVVVAMKLMRQPLLAIRG
jgi:coenzyme F420 hydrogenase subunit beta